jgi:hypothetical protein
MATMEPPALNEPGDTRSDSVTPAASASDSEESVSLSEMPLPWRRRLPGDADDDDPRQQPRGGAWSPDLEEMMSNAYQLLNMALGDARLVAMIEAEATEAQWQASRESWELGLHPLERVHHRRRGELIRCLGSVAYAVRARDDQIGILKALNTNVGVDIEDARKKADTRKLLSLRQACNRIIHAIEIDCGDLDPLAPVVHLRGKQKGVEWATIIHLVWFVRETARVCPGL